MAVKSKFEAEKAKETSECIAEKAHQDIVYARKEAEDAKILSHSEAEQAIETETSEKFAITPIAF